MFDYWERREEMWNEYFAKDDAIRERYWREAEDMRNESLMSDEYQEYMQKQHEKSGSEYKFENIHWIKCGKIKNMIKNQSIY